MWLWPVKKQPTSIPTNQNLRPFRPLVIEGEGELGGRHGGETTKDKGRLRGCRKKYRAPETGSKRERVFGKGIKRGKEGKVKERGRVRL